MAKKQEQSNGLRELKAHIKGKSPARLYFFYGEEVFLLHHYLDQLRKILVDELTESFNFHKLTNENFDIREFADCVENLPMMADSTMVWVDEIDIFKMSEPDRDKMVDILETSRITALLFFRTTTPWKPDKRLKKLWETIEQNAVVVEFAKQDQRDLIAWISRHFAASGKRITPELCAYLIELTGGTMTALAGEISKICAYSGADDIRKNDIDAVTEPVLDAVVFQMTEQMGQREYGPALTKLQTLLKMQEEPLAILGAVGGHFRRMATARTLLDNAKTSDDLAKLCGIQEYAARKVMAAAGRFSPRFYTAAAELVMETDRKIKTSYDDPERLLELLLVRLAQEARND